MAFDENKMMLGFFVLLLFSLLVLRPVALFIASRRSGTGWDGEGINNKEMNRAFYRSKWPVGTGNVRKAMLSVFAVTAIIYLVGFAVALVFNIKFLF